MKRETGVRLVIWAFYMAAQIAGVFIAAALFPTSLAGWCATYVVLELPPLLAAPSIVRHFTGSEA